MNKTVNSPLTIVEASLTAVYARANYLCHVFKERLYLKGILKINKRQKIYIKKNSFC